MKWKEFAWFASGRERDGKEVNGLMLTPTREALDGIDALTK